MDFFLFVWCVGRLVCCRLRSVVVVLANTRRTTLGRLDTAMHCTTVQFKSMQREGEFRMRMRMRITLWCLLLNERLGACAMSQPTNRDMHPHGATGLVIFQQWWGWGWWEVRNKHANWCVCVCVCVCRKRNERHQRGFRKTPTNERTNPRVTNDRSLFLGDWFLLPPPPSAVP